MKMCHKIKFVLLMQLMCVLNVLQSEALSSTAQYITQNKYPVEEHKVNTSDGYVLTIFRIPNSPQPQNSSRPRPAILLKHGFTLTSDAWVLSHPTAGLAYLLADAGFDVWLANQRGSRYSREHRNLPRDDAGEFESAFWNYSIHEIGYFDLAAMIDYIVDVIQCPDKALHYVGYSQGTTALVVLMSTRPEYKQHLKSIHLLAPVVFMKNMRQIFAYSSGIGSYLGNKLWPYLGHGELFRFSEHRIYQTLCNWVCATSSPTRFICSGFYGIIGGMGSPHWNDVSKKSIQFERCLYVWNLNLPKIEEDDLDFICLPQDEATCFTDNTLLSNICEMHPAGSSTKQLLHFLQLRASGDFHQFDYGSPQLNMKHYQQSEPPHYNVSSIEKCINLYYGDNDLLSDVRDVEYLTQVLPCTEVHRMSSDKWNHYDFLFSTDVKEMLCDKIIEKVLRYEGWWN